MISWLSLVDESGFQKQILAINMSLYFYFKGYMSYTPELLVSACRWSFDDANTGPVNVDDHYGDTDFNK